MFLGHSHPAVVEAVELGLKKGQLFAGQHEGEIELAELVCEIVPCGRDGAVQFDRKGRNPGCVAHRAGSNRRHTKKDGYVPAHPPAAVVKAILATPDPSLPVLAGITTTPVFGRGGELLTKPGYHADARLLYDPPPGFVLPAVPAKPTPSDITSARQLLLDDLLGDFPFTGDAERAHGLSLLLTGFVRAMIEGPTPLHLVEKPTPGTGATLMVDAVAMIVTGGGVSVMVEGRDDEEWRKRITAKLRQVPSLILIDNLRRQLDSSALSAALTAPFWEDRVLGISEMVRLPIRCLWVATGNNPEFSNEMARRLIRIRLDARVDQPWRRSGFRHPNLTAWVKANRGKLVAACLTLCRAWVAAGMPRGGTIVGQLRRLGGGDGRRPHRRRRARLPRQCGRNARGGRC